MAPCARIVWIVDTVGDVDRPSIMGMFLHIFQSLYIREEQTMVLIFFSVVLLMP